MASQSFTWTIAAAPSGNAPPMCEAAAPSRSEIWPPNHKRTDVIRIVGVTDPDGDAITIRVNRILQDEPTDTLGDGATAIDGGGIGTAQAWVRAERSGSPRVPGNGRIYAIEFVAADGNGGTCTGAVLVAVPHDRGKGPAVDDGVRYDSTIAGGGRIR